MANEDQSKKPADDNNPESNDSAPKKDYGHPILNAYADKFEKKLAENPEFKAKFDRAVEFVKQNPGTSAAGLAFILGSGVFTISAAAILASAKGREAAKKTITGIKDATINIANKGPEGLDEAAEKGKEALGELADDAKDAASHTVANGFYFLRKGVRKGVKWGFDTAMGPEPKPPTPPERKPKKGPDSNGPSPK